MIRDFSAMLWSSYNFWCKREYDGTNCDYSKWADPAKHLRSPELFHELVQAEANGTEGVVQPFYYPMEKPCTNAGGYYSEYLQAHLFSRQLRNHTILVASEELDVFPDLVAQRVAQIVNYSIAGIDLSSFTRSRVNTQEAKGTTAVVSKDKYLPGRYNISHYQPMLEQSRALLNGCWKSDCKLIASLPPHYHYQACFPDIFSSTAVVATGEAGGSGNNNNPSTAGEGGAREEHVQSKVTVAGVQYRVGGGIAVPVPPP